MTSTIFMIAATLAIAAFCTAVVKKRDKKPNAKLASVPALSKGSACVWQMDKEA